MSIMHVTKNGKKKTFEISDNKSQSLHRYVNLDTGQMYYTMGKQIGGKPINSDGPLGKKLIATANEAFENWHLASKSEPKKESSPTTRVITWICFVLWFLFCVKFCF